MSMNSFSLCFGLSATVVLSVALPVRSATVDFSQLELIKTRPIESNRQLSLFGDPSTNQGLTAFLNPAPSASDRGHLEISLNAPGNIAPYYATGRNASPEETGSTRSATLEGISSFNNFSNYLQKHSIPLENIGFGFGQKSDRDFTETWNLGDDLFGQDWLASSTSPIEERIYQANPNAVESFLTLGNTKLVDFGYSPFYTVFNYGETTATNDDSEVFLTDPVNATKAAGLDPLAEGLANAFLEDLNRDRIQLVIDDRAVPETSVVFNNGFAIANIRLPVSIRAVSVPEPSSILGFLAIAFSSLAFHNKKARNRNRTHK